MICRGCGGTGVDITLPPRLLQIAHQPIIFTFGEGAKLKRRRTLTFTGSDEHVTMRRWMDEAKYLNEFLALYARFLEAGGTPDHEFPLSAEHACAWCNGNGDPTDQLTVRALQDAIGAGG